MQTAKIIQKFFTKSQAQAHAAYLKLKAKKENVLLAGIEIVNAYELYKTNSWFKKSPFKHLGMPTVDSYLVIVHYQANVCEPIRPKVIKKKIKKAVANGTVSRTFFVVKPSQKQTKEINALKLRPLSKTAVVKYIHLTTCSPGRNKMRLALHPLDMRYSIAA